MQNIHSPIDIGIALPKYSSASSAMYRTKHKFIPAEPELRQNLDLSNQFLTTINNENFLLADDGNELRIIIFGTRDFFFKCSQLKIYILMEHSIQFQEYSCNYIQFMDSLRVK